MIQKLFPLDKNYILRQSQTALEEEMLLFMVDELKKSYTTLFNPLQLVDETYAKILNTHTFPKERLQLIYRQLSGVYRFKYGSNQLEFLFDGRSHFEKYQDDWRAQLKIWCEQMGTHELYVKAVLRMTVLYDTESRAQWAENQCKSFINDFFDLKIIKRRGELRLKMG
jgi:alpha-amylase/alpha-mannosidase (GH57 family)